VKILATLCALLLVGACGRSQKIAEPIGRGAPTPRLPPPTHIDSVFVLESSGAEPEDTVVKVPLAQGRVILVRRGAPDNSLFAQVDVKRATSGRTDTLQIAIRPRPGRYGVDLEFTADSATRVSLTFSYALNFVAPAGARARYGSDLEFEKVLLIARLDSSGRVTFLPTTSPGADLVTATVGSPGRYLVAAPRS
jgi:hypothetical protein